MQRARLVLRKPREEVVQMARQVAGMHWSEEGADQAVPCNVLAMYLSIVGRKLIANDPRVMLSTDEKEFKAPVSIMETWANKQIRRIRFADVEARVVENAMYSIGIAKVALATPAESGRAVCRRSPPRRLRVRCACPGFLAGVFYGASLPRPPSCGARVQNLLQGAEDGRSLGRPNLQP